MATRKKQVESSEPIDETSSIKFEDALGQLEQIVASLEQGTIGLEQAMELFKDGMHLVSVCDKKLVDAQEKIALLVQGKDGSFGQIPMPPQL